MFRIFALLIVGFFGVASLGSYAERWLLYPFDSARIAPGSVGLNAVSEQIMTIKGTQLVVWTAPPKRGKPIILYFHGNAGNLANRAGRFQRFLDRGYGLVAPAYRGSSGSKGTPDQDILTQDATTIAMQLATRTAAFADFAPKSPIVIYGESLGTAVSIQVLNAKSIGHNQHISAVVLEAPFTSLKDLAAEHYSSFAALADSLDSQWRSIDVAPLALSSPLLVIHGTNDTLIPISQGRRIFQAAPTRSKQFIAVKGAGHTDLWRSDVLPRLWSFIDKVL
ncbi:alpha/beta hydrolase [Cognatishimia sp. WU-CL00825]|uniref:alpha/beta hydrolase n=1 Tax=Cognatishimia sp. WU-CL00825 TaxID=3127658 RepID=UPI0031064B9E